MYPYLAKKDEKIKKKVFQKQKDLVLDVKDEENGEIEKHGKVPTSTPYRRNVTEENI